MRAHASLALCAAALIAACGNSSPRVLLLEPVHAPPEIQRACALAEVRCSSCHTLERLTNGVHRTAPEWTRQVNRMRLMPASGISQIDADTIVTCLVYRDPDVFTPPPP
ncbi:hypothetical protein BH11MYX3_BH11MYX3_33730 [soil metagenome]